MNAAPRRFLAALALSLAAHALFFLWAPNPAVPRHALSAQEGPMIVTLEESAPAAAAPPPRPTSKPSPARPSAPKRIITARPRTPPAAPPVAAPPPPTPAPTPPPMPAPPAMDMLAMINARRARRAAEAAAQAREGAAHAPPLEDEGARALARNLETLKGDDRTGGIFQILEKGSYDAEYAFNGWRPDTQRRWREVIEVHVKPGEDIDRAIVRSMIALIRTHYTGDFLWESRRLGKVVTLSARPEDNDGLEDFLIREFFGTPLINRPAAQR